MFHAHARWFVLLVMLLFVLGLGVPPGAQAAVGDGLTFTIGCDGFSADGALRLDRDNTGARREAITIIGTDGAGRTIFGPLSTSFLLDTTLGFEGGARYAWTSAPAASPLSVRVLSVAGNGLAEAVVVRAEGTCDRLPAGGDRVEPSSAVPLNAPIPVAANTPEQTALALSEAGHLVVNTAVLNLRNGAGAGFSRVAVIPGGERLRVLGRDARFAWWFVEVGGLRGWVSNTFVIVRGDLRGTPVVASEGTLAPAVVLTFVPIRLYDAPAGRVVCNAAPREARAIGRDGGSAFFQVETVCEDGTPVTAWFRAEDVIFRNPSGRALPVTG